MVWRDKREYVSESGEVEDVEHMVMRCAHVKEERGKLMELMERG